ncbi:MAG: OmpA family protein [Proteobacteria bacterium]|nr:OmpA family protein [Pseudomonadota bacterium]
MKNPVAMPWSSALRALPALSVCILALCLITAKPAQAADRFNFLRVRPNADLGNYFFVQESRSLPQLGFTLGTSLLYYDEPLNIDMVTEIVRRTGRTTSVATKDGVDGPLFQWFYGALGFVDWFSLGFDIPLFYTYRYTWSDAAGRYSGREYGSAGDLNLFAKFRILDLDEYPVGIAFMPSVTAPTGRESHFLGDSGVTGEARLIVEIKPADRLTMAANVAFQTREKVQIGDFSFRDVLKIAAAANLRVAKSTSIIAEIETQTATGDFYGSRSTSPAEARLGARHKFENGLSVGGGGSVGLVHGGGMPRYAGFVNLAYTHRPAPREHARIGPLDEAPSCTRLAADGEPGRYTFLCEVYFDFDDATISPEDRGVVEAIAEHIAAGKGTVAVEVRGWTDTTGTKQYNRGLAGRRAEALAAAIEGELARTGGQAQFRKLAVGEDSVSAPSEARRAEVLTMAGGGL